MICDIIPSDIPTITIKTIIRTWLGRFLLITVMVIVSEVLNGGVPLSVTVVNSDRQITLNWQGADPNNSCITNFKIFRSSDSRNWIEIGDTDHNTTSYLNAGLAAETTYYYQVMSANLIGVSDPGNVVQAATQKTPAESGSKCFISNIMNSTLLRSFKEWFLSILKIDF